MSEKPVAATPEKGKTVEDKDKKDDKKKPETTAIMSSAVPTFGAKEVTFPRENISKESTFECEDFDTRTLEKDAIDVGGSGASLSSMGELDFLANTVECSARDTEDSTAPAKDDCSGSSTDSIKDALSSSRLSDSVFPLLQLPLELLMMIFALLPTPDRMRLRGANRMLYDLEATGQFDCDGMEIGGVYHYDVDEASPEVVFHPSGDRENYVDSLRKLASNTTFDYIMFCPAPEDMSLIPLIRACRSKQLQLFEGGNPEFTREQFNDSTLDSWIEDRITFFVCGKVYFTGDRLFSLYQAIQSGSTLLMLLILHDPDHYECIRLLELIGLKLDYDFTDEEEGFFYSNRRDIQVWVKAGTGHEQDEEQDESKENITTNPANFYLILIGNMKMCIRKMAIQRYEEGWAQLQMERVDLPDDVFWEGFSLNFYDFEIREPEFEQLPIIYCDILPN